jgi:sulfate transport system permease protein
VTAVPWDPGGSGAALREPAGQPGASPGDEQARARRERALARSRRGTPLGAWALRAIFAGYVAFLVAVPLGGLLVRGTMHGPAFVWENVTDSTALDALGLSLSTGFVAALVNAVMGTTIAWMLVRWNFPGRSALSALVDLPLAIPTLVAGILLVALYGPASSMGQALEATGISIAYAKPGIVLALLFVTLPFVVRAVEPVLHELDPAEEEAAMTLGAGKLTTFVRVLLPPILPAIAAGSVQTFARCVAEFGSIAAVSGNIPHETLTAPVYILGEVERGNADGAAAVSVVLLLLALALQPISRGFARLAGATRV